MFNWIPPPHDVFSWCLLIAWLMSTAIFCIGLVVLGSNVFITWFGNRIERKKKRHYQNMRYIFKTSWGLEATQDYESARNTDAEVALTELMADEMVAEIDSEMLSVEDSKLPAKT